MLSFPPHEVDSFELEVRELFASAPEPMRSYPRAPTPWEGLSDYVDEASLEVGDDTGLLDVRRMAASYGFLAEAQAPRPNRIARASEAPGMVEAYVASLPPAAAAPDEKVARVASAAVVVAAAIASFVFAVAFVAVLG